MCWGPITEVSAQSEHLTYVPDLSLVAPLPAAAPTRWARGRQRCERYGQGRLGVVGASPGRILAPNRFGAPFSHRVFAFRCCPCFRHFYLTHPRPRGMRINALKATVLATLNYVTRVLLQ